MELHPQAHPADDPDAARRAHADLRRDPVRAGRARRAGGARPAPRRRGRAAAFGMRTHTGVDAQQVAQLKALYGFDKPPLERYVSMLGKFARFDLGDSYFRHQSVWSLIESKLPVSISIGLWTFFITYLISVPLGIAKAVRNGSTFDFATSLHRARRLRDSGLRARRAAARAVRRRHVLATVSAARPDLGQLGDAELSAARSSTICGTSRCRWRRRWSAASPSSRC